MRRLLRWLFLVGPCRIYLRGDANGGSVPVVFILGLFSVAAAAGGVGALLAVISGSSAEDFFWGGAIAGFGVVTAWAVYSGLLLVVLWIVGRPPRTIPGVAEAVPSTRPVNAERPVRADGRRRRSNPLVPAAVAWFFVLMVMFFFGDATLTSVLERKYSGDKVAVAGELLRYDEPRWGFGHRELVVRYPVDGEALTGSMRADEVEARVPGPGEPVQVEYVVADPLKVRRAGAAEFATEDASDSRLIGSGWQCWRRRRT
ncbi:hypothetical protein EV644_105164 [Kribbella orskensis]|uniref:DUF3592 domain-containing protein n=1 Tax=Kribbella orskensis TaxID=2512216 RepID=A0ABY2BL92_9ACTN|nr:MULTISPECIES: hypothetical protein [Kribbella]TCN40880.1 hypothetical protein EV642_104164 [Kribbella sp. VKM Ac-2500]TCO24132.1 hypothetical protein EV644_105164 [Kribbella orskensis]